LWANLFIRSRFMLYASASLVSDDFHLLWSVIGPTRMSNGLALTDHDDYVLDLHVYRLRAYILPRDGDLKFANLTVN
jgi:hypothetical protein